MSQNSRIYNAKCNLQFMYYVSNGHRESWLKEASQLLNQFPPGFVYVNIITERIPSDYREIPGYRLASIFLTSPNVSKFPLLASKCPWVSHVSSSYICCLNNYMVNSSCFPQLYVLFQPFSNPPFLSFLCVEVRERWLIYNENLAEMGKWRNFRGNFRGFSLYLKYRHAPKTSIFISILMALQVLHRTLRNL